MPFRDDWKVSSFGLDPMRKRVYAEFSAPAGEAPKRMWLLTSAQGGGYEVNKQLMDKLKLKLEDFLPGSTRV